MLKLYYKFNEKPFTYTVSEKELHTALKKIMRDYFAIKKDDTTVHVTKARWIIDWFLDIPFLEDKEMLEHVLEEMDNELNYYFYEKARDEFYGVN